MNRNQGGFTLIELMIVVVVIAIIAAVAIPNLMSARATANERAVVAAMKSIATAQVQAMTATAVDVDNDGVGEALSLIELAGSADLRGRAVRLDPTSLSAALGIRHSSGFVLNKGYLLGLYLPNSTGVGVLGIEANFASIDPNMAENSWTCVAWPLKRGAGETAAYFINQMSEIVFTRDATYSGTASLPPAGAALVGVPPANISGGTLAVNQAGADGNTWRGMQ